MRLQVDQTYDAATNSSTLVFSIWVYSEYYDGYFRAYDGSTLSINGSVVQTFSLGGNTYYAVTTDWSNTWRQLTRHDGQGPDTWTVTVQHQADGSASVTGAFNGILGYTTNGITYLMKWDNSDSADASVARQFTLTISADNHVQVTVTRNGTSLPSGAQILLGDVLTVTAAATGGYQIQSATINGADFTSPATVNVTGNVAVLVTSTASGFAYIWNSGAWAPYLIYLWVSNAWTRYRAYVYTQGAWVPYG